MRNRNSISLTILLVSLYCTLYFYSGWAKPVSVKVKDFIEEVADSLKGAVDQLGNNLVAIQDYLDNYHWKGLIQDEASSNAATLKHLQLNGHPKAVVVKPGERIEGVVLCTLDREKCTSLGLYRVLLGFKGQGAQTTIGNEFGIVAGESLEKFALIAPKQPGIYEIRFRLVEAYFESNALNYWTDDNGNEPDGTTTVGVVLVN